MYSFYRKSPYFLQNIFVTIENMAVLYKKYGYIPIFRPMRKIANEVSSNTMVNDPSSLVKRINKLINYAILHTQYYRDRKELYRNIDFIEEISNLPILEKKSLKKENFSFFSDEARGIDCRTLYTSGSTGTPLKIKVKVNDLQLRFRILLKTMLEFGFDPTKPLGRITGHDICDEKVIYRQDFINQHFFLSAFHISSSNIEKYYQVIVTNAIETLEGYPSAIYLMAKLFEKYEYKIECVKFVFTTAEKLHDYQKKTIEKVFNCKVFNYYGSNDQSIFIYTCSKGRLHTSDMTGFLEILNDENKPVAPGEEGNMVVTSFTSSYTPLIRYKIGDMCKLALKQECECGSGGIIIDEIIGRDEDVFKTLDGHFVTRFSVVLKYLPDTILESQIYLNNKTRKIILYYVADASIPEEKFDEFRKKLVSKVGLKYHIEYEKVDIIPQTSKGKKKAVRIEKD